MDLMLLLFQFVDRGCDSSKTETTAMTNCTRSGGACPAIGPDHGRSLVELQRVHLIPTHQDELPLLLFLGNEVLGPIFLFVALMSVVMLWKGNMCLICGVGVEPGGSRQSLDLRVDSYLFFLESVKTFLRLLLVFLMYFVLLISGRKEKTCLNYRKCSKKIM